MSVAYVMAAQSLSGIAKDLTKMSAKSTIKLIAPDNDGSALFRWVAVLTGSKNALKGVGFFLGGLLLTTLGFKRSLWTMAGVLLLVLLGSVLSLPAEMGKAKTKSKLKGLLSKSRDINLLSAARFFLFGSRDIWFVVGVPVFLSASLGWTFNEVGGFLAAWVIGYGIVQSAAPALIARWTGGRAPDARAAQVLAFLLAATTAMIAAGITIGLSPHVVMLGGLGLFGLIFALSSSVHSYLILAYSDGDQIALNVGFYYMANAAGRLVGTLLSGVMYQVSGVAGCLWASALFAALASVLSTMLRGSGRELMLTEMKGDAAGGD